MWWRRSQSCSAYSAAFTSSDSRHVTSGDVLLLDILQRTVDGWFLSLWQNMGLLAVNLSAMCEHSYVLIKGPKLSSSSVVQLHYSEKPVSLSAANHVLSKETNTCCIQLAGTYTKRRFPLLLGSAEDQTACYYLSTTSVHIFFPCGMSNAIEMQLQIRWLLTTDFQAQDSIYCSASPIQRAAPKCYLAWCF